MEFGNLRRRVRRRWNGTDQRRRCHCREPPHSSTVGGPRCVGLKKKDNRQFEINSRSAFRFRKQPAAWVSPGGGTCGLRSFGQSMAGPLAGVAHNTHNRLFWVALQPDCSVWPRGWIVRCGLAAGLFGVASRPELFWVRAWRLSGRTCTVQGLVAGVVLSRAAAPRGTATGNAGLVVMENIAPDITHVSTSRERRPTPPDRPPPNCVP